eukprot:11189154-Lingulodinium_polyedra.AAC.1
MPLYFAQKSVIAQRFERMQVAAPSVGRAPSVRAGSLLQEFGTKSKQRDVVRAVQQDTRRCVLQDMIPAKAA